MKDRFKLAFLLQFIFTSGIMYLTTGPRMGDHYEYYRYLSFDLFQFGPIYLFALPAICYNSSKDILLWNANVNLAPLVNVLAAMMWASIISYLFRLLSGNKQKVRGVFWKRIFIVNFWMSIMWFVLWFFMDIEYMLSGYLGFEQSVFEDFLHYFAFLFFLPSILPAYIADVWLQSGTELIVGYENMELTSRTESAFSTLFWSFMYIVVGDWVQRIRRKIWLKRLRKQ